MTAWFTRHVLLCRRHRGIIASQHACIILHSSRTHPVHQAKYDWYQAGGLLRPVQFLECQDTILRGWTQSTQLGGVVPLALTYSCHQFSWIVLRYSITWSNSEVYCLRSGSEVAEVKGGTSQTEFLLAFKKLECWVLFLRLHSEWGARPPSEPDLFHEGTLILRLSGFVCITARWRFHELRSSTSIYIHSLRVSCYSFSNLCRAWQNRIFWFGYAHGNFPFVACNVSVKVYPRSLQTIDIDLEVSSVAKVHVGKAWNSTAARRAMKLAEVTHKQTKVGR